MDSYEATRIVFSRIQNLDPENASKIMGLLLIQDHGEKEMIRLAFGPEALVHSVVLKARKDLGLPSNSPPTPTTPSSPNPFLLSTNPIAISRQNSSFNSSSRLSNFLPPALTIPNPSSNSASSASWAGLSDLRNNPDELMSPNNFALGPSSASMNSSSLPFYGTGTTEVMDDFQLQDQLSFFNDGPKNPDLFYHQQDLSSSPNGAVNWGGSNLHRRSCSFNDVCLGSDDPNSGFGWKPCLYYARGFCKNGTSCRFLHGGLGDSTTMVGSDGSTVVGSPSKLEMMDQTCHELLRSKSAQQQRIAAASQLMASSASSFPYSPKCMSFLLQQQQNDTQRAAAALMMGEDLHKFGRSPRNEFSINGGGGGSSMVNPASRQIYLTFPADSTFREEDVSNYFSIYGPVQDVRIPYQQKRMFGFVTFVYPDTVKIILAKGNPHFVCDARVLVKPYKEKGKVQEKKQQQQVERGDFSPCGTPTGMDSRDAFDLQQLAPRMFYNTQDILWRRKLEEQAELQQALELQSRRLLNLQLLDVKKHQGALSTGSPTQSPIQSPGVFNQSLMLSSSIPQENNSLTVLNPGVTSSDQTLPPATALASGKEPTTNVENTKGKESPRDEVGELLENLEHNLPDSPFASPTKAAVEYMSGFSNLASEAANATDSDAPPNTNLATSLLPGASTLEVGTFKSFNCQVPGFSSGHGAIGMYAGNNGSKCPVGI